MSHGAGVRRGRADRPAFGLEEFLERYPDFAVRPEAGGGVRLVGRLERILTADGLPDLADAFQLELVLSPRFPKVAPRVFETAGRIPAKYHKFDSGALCLSSPLRVTLALRTTPRLLPFFENFVIPYLYRYAHIEEFKKDPWPDIKHSVSDLIDDYARLLGAYTHQMCLGYLDLLGMKRRRANKKACPCGSGVRVARCRRHHRWLNALRQKFKVVPRGWFRAEHADLVRAIDGQPRKKAAPEIHAEKPRSILRLPKQGRTAAPEREAGFGDEEPRGRARVAVLPSSPVVAVAANRFQR